MAGTQKKSDQKKYPLLARVPWASVKKNTKRDWDSWVEILDKATSRQWTHQEIVRLLREKYRLTPWWQQQVAIGYEVAAGIRVEGQNSKGEYSVTVTKALRHDAKKIWRIIASEAGLEAWMGPLDRVVIQPQQQFETTDGAFGEIRTVHKGKKLRLKWQDPDWAKHTYVELIVVPRAPVQGKPSCFIGISHQNLASPRIREKMRDRWRQALHRVVDLVA